MTKPLTTQVRIKSITLETDAILSYDLRAADGGLLPPFTAGAHIDLHLPNGLVRSYSIFNSQDERHRYLVGIHRDPNSRGGSRCAHEKLRVGDLLTISVPRNNFALSEAAPHTVLIAGGIGITPLWSMIQRLETLGRSWALHYCARTSKHAALMEQISALGKNGSHVHFNFDGEPGGQMLDFGTLVGPLPRETHFYCCGPVPMLRAFEAATASRPADCIHVEYFANTEAQATEGGFVVEAARSGKSIAIAPGKTILQACLDAGINVPYSCMEGICGSCEVRVLGGIPDHRDHVLSKEEHARNTSIIVCCSGSRGDKLVLDL
jgi:vanillate O-demethylase ferredoxin subunit